MANKSEKSRFSGLTKRWFVQTTITVIAFLLIVSVAGAYAIHSYYYTSVERRLLNYSNNVIDTYFTEPVIICNVIKMLYKLSKKSFIVVCMSVAGVKLNSSCIIVKI